MCKNPDDYNGKLVPPGLHTTKTCDYIIDAYNFYPAFKERDCDPKRGYNPDKKQECTGGDGCRLDMVGPLMHGIRHCCKGGMHVCAKGKETSGACVSLSLSVCLSLSLSLSLYVCMYVCVCVCACACIYVCTYEQCIPGCRGMTTSGAMSSGVCFSQYSTRRATGS